MILEELISAEPTNGGWRNNLADIYNKVGKIQKCHGDTDGALLSYGGALTVRSKLLDENPDDLASMLRVARSDDLVGEVLQLGGQTEKARAHYRHATELGKRMLGRDPNNVAARDLLAIVETKIGLPVDAGPGDGLRACANP